MKTLFTFLLLTIAISTFAQDTLTYKAYRSVWSVIPRIGIGDKDTRSYFTTYESLGLRREFALFSFLSANAVASYSSAYGRHGNPNLNVLNVGGGFTIYPFGIVNIVNNIIYGRKQSFKNVYKDFYIEISGETNVNDTKYGYAGDVGGPRAEGSFGRYAISKGMFFAPKLGFQAVIFSKTQFGGNRPDQFNFYYIGAGFGFNPKPKNR